MANYVAVANLQTGRELARVAASPSYFSTTTSYFGDHVFDGVASLLTPASVMAISFPGYF